MITREQVADLRDGDVVELHRNEWPDGTLVRGPLYEVSGWLYVAEAPIRTLDEGRTVLPASYSLTVVSRVPRPLYVNHPRTEPVPGDVVGDDDTQRTTTWVKNSDGLSHEWLNTTVHIYVSREELPARLRLLVDGETGQVVP